MTNPVVVVAVLFTLSLSGLAAAQPGGLRAEALAEGSGDTTPKEAPKDAAPKDSGKKAAPKAPTGTGAQKK